MPTAFAATAVEPTDSPNDAETVFDLVTLVVDIDLYQNNDSYIGLGGLDETKLGNRVMRYAEDIRKNNELTDVKILFYDKSKDTVLTLASALENMYFNGDGDNNNRLSGVVLIGDVPLPVVNKDGDRFVSLFPYTDFVEKAYLYNEKTNNFEPNKSVTYSKPEIWHGIIKAPTNNTDGREKLATFFDKNHLYYEGDPMYSKFDRKMFFGDLKNEEGQMNKETYQKYLEYLKSLEDLAYFRYNKKWASELSKDATSVLDDIDIADPALAQAMQGANNLEALPDIYSKQIIDQFLPQYYKVVNKYISQVNDFADYTARYQAKGGMNVDSVPALITLKDEYTKYYLRSVNDALEAKINKIVEMIQEPLPLVEYSKLTGKIGDEPFSESFFRYHYLNEDDGKMYVNGVNADILESAQQCSVYLGSSGLTRAIRSDNPATARPLLTTGVNTRMLPAEELPDDVEAGAIIENKPEYGISAFIDNPLFGEDLDYKGPFEAELKVDDIIVSVNGRNLSYDYTFDQAIKESFNAVKTVVDKVNDDKAEDLDNFPYPIEILQNQNLSGADIVQAVGHFSVGFYRDGDYEEKYFSFSVNSDGLPTREASAGDPRVTVLLAKDPDLDFEGPDEFSKKSDGAIFSLYNNDISGYSAGAYDASAGCNAKSTEMNSDRCIGKVATMPVLDPGGAVAVDEIVERASTNDGNRASVYEYPAGKTFSDIDEVIYNACYSGLPTTTADLAKDSNLFVLATDKGSQDSAEIKLEIPKDFYGRLIHSIGNFVTGGRGDQVDYEDGDTIEKSTNFNPQKEIWQGFDKLDASEIILNDEPLVTLKNFSDHYGLFDGIDNDGDGLTDYRWTDGKDDFAGDDDGVYETRFYDFEEASLDYGIPSGNLDEIARKMLAHPSEYTVPYGIGSFDYDELDENITLVVGTAKYEDKDISSVIIHNEPTDHTITEQLKSINTKNLPIDDPRYVAFQSLTRQGPEYPKPQPKNSDIDVDEILKNITEEAPYSPGDIEKVDYINLFSEKIPNMAQLAVELDVKALELAKLPGSYRIFGADAVESDYTKAEIKKKILEEDLKPAAFGDFDSPENGFNLEVASQDKVYDAYEWLHMNIDEKHEYILRNYLNGEINAYADDKTVYPKPVGYDEAYGYEAAYLVLDGEDDYFDMRFNQDLPEENDPSFNRLEAILAEYDAEDENEDGPAEGVDGQGENADGSGGDDFVPLSEFLNEIKRFLNELENFGELQDACSYIAGNGLSTGLAKVYSDNPIAKLQVGTQYQIVSVSSSEYVDVMVSALDSEDAVVGGPANTEVASLVIEQNEERPTFELVDINNKAFVNGEVSFRLRPTGNTGSALVSANTPEGLVSNKVNILATGSKLDMTTYGYTKLDGVEQLMQQLEEEGILAGESVEDLGGSSGGGEGDGDGNGDSENQNGSNGSQNFADNTTEGGVSFNETLGKIVKEVSKKKGLSKAEKKILDSFDEESEDGDGNVGGSENVGGDEVESENNGENEVVGESLDGGGVNGNSGNGIDSENSNVDSQNSNVGQKDKIIEILQSTPVEETLPGESFTEEKTDSEASLADSEAEKVEIDDEVETPEEEIQKVSEDLKWEEYFIQGKYYQRFLEEDLEAGDRRLVAELIGDTWLPEPQNTDSYVIGNASGITADGQSRMKVEVEIYNSNGELERDKTHKVRFSMSENLASFVGGDIAESENGRAEIALEAGKKTGTFILKAEVLKANNTVDTNYPVTTKEIALTAGVPVKVEIKADSGVLVANEQSKTSVEFTLKDEFGNTANNSFEQIAIFADAKLRVDERNDSNKKMIGVQLSTFEGKGSVDVFAKDETGLADIAAVILDYEKEQELLENDYDLDKVDLSKFIGLTKEFTILDEVKLQLNILNNDFKQVDQLTADGTAVAQIGVKLVSNEKVVTSYNGPIKISLLTPTLGSFSNKIPEKLVNGELNAANVIFKSSTVSGEAEILVEVLGFASEIVKLKMLPGKASQMQLSSDSDSLATNSQKSVVIKAILLDKYGNLVESNSGTKVNFKTTAATENLVNFSAKTAVTLNGEAAVSVFAKESSGEVNISADSEGLKSATLTLKISKHIDKTKARDFAPRALYMSLLGGDFGKISDASENLAEVFLSEGQVQVITTVMSDNDSSKQLFNVDAKGKLEIFDENLEVKVTQATDSFPYQKMVISDGFKKKELASVILSPKNNLDLAVSKNPEEELEEGIYVRSLQSAVEENFKITKSGDAINVEMDEVVIARITKDGKISLNDTNLKLRAPDELDGVAGDGFRITLSKGLADLALITFKNDFNQVVQKVEQESEIADLSPGVYVKMSTTDKRYELVASFGDVSSKELKGMYLVDKEGEIKKKKDLEFGSGFTGDDKHMLLFAAGNSVGESYLPYAKENGIIYGDPMIKLAVEDDLVSELTGYTKDIGKPIFTGDEEILQMLDLDYNGDGLDDLMLVYEDGLIRLLENEESNKRFRDRGYVLNIPNGIFSAARIDVNNDGYDDMIVGTKESCNVNEECLTLIKNINGAFERSSLNLALGKQKTYEVKAGDMDNDGCEDLVLSDSSSNIKIFYNQTDGEKCTGLAKNSAYTRNFGFNVNAELNQADQMLVNYPGMGSVADKASVQFVLEIGGASGEFADDIKDFQNDLINNENIASMEIPALTTPTELSFVNIKEDSRLALNSTKQSVDLNGGNVALYDQVEYLITLDNDSNTAINNLRLSDATPLSLTLLPETLKCLNCTDNLQWQETGMSLRAQVITNINIPAQSQKIISYRMRVDALPKIHFDIGNDFVKYPSSNDDEYLDVMVRPEVNADGVLNYIYSTGLRKYEKYQFVPKGNDEVVDPKESQFAVMFAAQLEAEEAQNEGRDAEIDPGLADGASNLLNQQVEDKNADGCPDSWSAAYATGQNLAESLANSLESFLNNLRCSGAGCVASPYNFAFLAPSKDVPGIAVFAAGLSAPPYFGALIPSSVFSTFRIYVSPTLTMGLGTAICVGPTTPGLASSSCYVFAVPGGIPGVCQFLQENVNKTLASAKNAVVNTAIGQSAIISNGSDMTGTDAVQMSDSGNAGPFSFAGAANIRIPGFPSTIVNWIDKQTEEIYNKLLDFPTFYLVLPDFSGMAKESKAASRSFSFKNFNDFATSISSFPFIQIEGKEIVVKVPAISPKEIAKYRIQAKFWMDHMDKEIAKIADWNCDISAERRTICDLILLDTAKAVSSVKKLLDMLDKIENLPKDILTWRNAEARYASQIICYLDAIMEYTGGYIKRQEKIINSWMKAIEDAVATFKDWEIILQLQAEYQASCDQCKSDHYSELGLLMQLFIAIPEPPIIPLPKWPDLVVDFSEIKTGVKIVWPDIVFRPEPIILPNLPVINLPEVNLLLPTATIEVPAFNVPNIPDFSKVTLPNLPNLPPLPLPKLPDLPRPPRIPKLPKPVAQLMLILKPAFKILCLLKTAQIPILELGVKTEIETLTQPTVQATLSFLKSFAMQYPAIEYNYVEQIKVTGKMSFEIETSVIYLVAEKGAKIWNDGVKGLVTDVNKAFAFPFGEIFNQLVKKAIDEANAQMKNEVININSSYVPPENKVANVEELAANYPQLEQLQQNVVAFNSSITNLSEELEQEYADLPDSYHLIVSQEFINQDNPILNKNIADLEEIDVSEFADHPTLSKIANLRNGLLAEAKGMESNNKLLENIEDMSEFSRILAQENSDEELLASLEIPDEGDDSSEKVEMSFFGKEVENDMKNLIAANIDFSPEVNLNPSTVLSNASQPVTAPPIGFFVAVGEVNENVLNYTAELKGKSQVIFSDVDEDNDHDIIYYMGGDVYLKENHKNEQQKDHGKVIFDYITYNDVSVADYVIGASVQGVSAPYTSNGKVDLSWLPYDGAVSYEVIIQNSLNDETDEYEYKYESVSPNISLSIPNGNYFVTVYAIDKDGKRSLGSVPVVISPQTCADKEPPLPVLQSTNYDVAIFKDVMIDASNSFDPDGEIKSYYIEPVASTIQKIDPETGKPLKKTKFSKAIWSDLNVLQDEDGDGTSWNDRNNPIFKIGPFVDEGDIGKHEFILYVEDASGLSAKQKFIVNVFAPDITLDESFSRNSVASGTTEPKVPYIPFTLMRSRYITRVLEEELKLVPRVEPIVNSYTDQNGDYSIANLNLENMIEVEDANGKIVAEINPESGNIGILDNNYKVEFEQANAPYQATSLRITDKSGALLGSIYLVADANQDVKIGQNWNAKMIEDLKGVGVNDLDDEDDFKFKSLPANDSGNPGGAILIYENENKPVLNIDTAGNIMILDGRITIEKKANNHVTDPVVLEVIFEGKVVAEIYIKIGVDAKFVAEKDVPFFSPKAPSDGILQGRQAGLKKGDDLNYVLEGVSEMADTDMISRKDFVRVLLKMLCIIPREEAYKPFAAGQGYADNESLGNYSPDIKEATMLNWIDGYKGEVDDEGLHPFKPDETITRAEAVKIILKALEFKNVIKLTGVDENTGGQWYAEYIKAAQNLDPYIVATGGLKNKFLVTELEALKPEEIMNFGELIEMVERVLDTYNCFEVDEDKDQMSDFCEEKYDIDDANADEDKDGLSNKDECYYKFDPTAKDTDKGGVEDGKELEIGTNPLDPSDDSVDEDDDGLSSISETTVYHTNPFDPDSDKGGKNDGEEVEDCLNPLNGSDDDLDAQCKNSEEGLYIVPAECNSCPCISTFLNKADIMKGDVFFPVISVSYDEPIEKTHIFSKGNEVRIETISQPQ
ncbi:MAG: FG-GAP-like repeat-containing protein [Patescibacteria group bacterium]